MKHKQVMFATLFGLSMVGQLLVRPAFGVETIPTKRAWEAASADMNLSDSTREKIGKQFDKYDKVTTDVSRNPIRIIQGPPTVRVYDYDKQITAADALKCALNTFITQLQKKQNNARYGAAINYLVHRGSDVVSKVEDLKNAKRRQSESIASAGERDPNFDEVYTLQYVKDLVGRARAKFSNIEQNPNNIDAFYRGDMRAITLVIEPLKRNKPQTYTEMVDAYNTKAAGINTALNSGNADRLKLVGQAKSAILKLSAELNELR